MKSLYKFLFTLSVVLFGAFYVWYTCGKSLIGIDDANIYFSYMRNLAEGKGFVFTNGGERVEGFTSLLWTLIGAFFYLFTTKIEILLFGFNSLILSYALWKLIRFVDDIYENKNTISSTSLLLLGALLLSPGFFEWTILSLMETGLWTSLLILIVVNLLDKFTNQKNSGLPLASLLILLNLCRPEALVWNLFFISVVILNTYFREEKSLIATIKSTRTLLLSYFLSLILLFTFRLIYFSYLFPNTFYAKVSMDFWYNIKQGFTYVRLSLENTPGLLFALLACFLLLFKSRKILQNSLFLLIFGGTILALMLPMLTGGDHFGLSRFIVPILPISFLVIVLFKEDFAQNLSYKVTILFLALLSFVNGNSFIFNFKYEFSPIGFEWSLPIEGRENAKKANEFFKELKKLPVNGIHIAGGLNYAYKGKSIDLLGLNDVAMAHADKVKERGLTKNHASFNKTIFYQKLPDLIWSDAKFIPNDTVIEKFYIYPKHKEMFKQIYTEEKFKKKYAYVLISKKAYKETLAIFASKVFLNKLDLSIYTIKKLDFE